MNSTERLIEQITKEISLYMPITLLVFGLYGCSCNFITFTSKQLKRSSCAFYFLCIAAIELPTFSFGLLSRLVDDRFGSTLFSTNKIYCKLRSYLIETLPCLITYMILLTVVDRFMLTTTKVHYRSFCQLKIAYRLVPLVIIISLLLPSHILIFFDFYPSCTAQPGIYSILYSIYLLIWTGILPYGSILLFSFLTYQNLVRKKRRIVPITMIMTTQQQRVQKTEMQLIVMMFGQAILSCSIDLIRIALYSYFVLTTNMPKSSYHRTVDALLLQISAFLLHTNCAKSFYVYTLSSRFFREIFRCARRQYYQKILLTLRIHH